MEVQEVKKFKKLTSFFCAVCILMSVAVPALAAEDVDIPEVGEVVHGFEVMEVHDFNTDDKVVLFEHQNTGAQLMYFATQDTERAFSIAFRTNAENDKGIPHVFEHAALAGSVKYPSSTLFEEMLNQTYNTYLNAMTAASATVYPCASMSEDQLYKFADVYLSGVFEPLVVTNQMAMEREAYHYELTSPDGDIYPVGIVYSEMQGSTGDPLMQAYYAARKLMFPGSYRTNVSGGIPEEILKMTHEEIQQFHAKYYHPSNCLMMLYGKLDYTRFLELIDTGYLSRYTRQEIDVADHGYVPSTEYKEEIYKLAVSADSPVADSGYFFYGIALDGATTEEETLIFKLLPNYLLSDTSPLVKLMKERLPKVSLMYASDNESPSPAFYFVGTNVNESDKEVFLATLKEGIAEIAANELDQEITDALIKSMAYAEFGADEDTYNQGVSMITDISLEWGPEGNIWAYFDQAAVINNMETYLTDGSVKAAFEKFFIDPAHTSLLIGIPEPGLLEANEAALLQAMAEKKAAMSDEEIAALIQATADLAAWNKNQPSLIDQVKVVSVANLPEEYTPAEVTDVTVDGIRSISSVVDVDNYVDVTFRINVSELPQESLRDFSYYMDLIGSIPTENYTVDELQAKYWNLFNTIDIDFRVVPTEDGFIPYFRVAFTALTEDIEACYDIIEEMMFRSDFSDVEFIRNETYKFAEDYEQTINGAPYQLAYDLANAAISETGAYSFYLDGLEYYYYLLDASQMDDASFAALMERVAAIPEMFESDGALFSTVSNEAGIEANTVQVLELFDSLGSDGVIEPVEYVFPEYPDSMAVIIDGTVQYNAVVSDNPIGDDGGLLAVLPMTSEVLMETLRYQLGAYSSLHHISGDSAYIISYRDPTIAEAYALYDTIPEIIASLQLTEEELEGYITSAYSSFVIPEGPIAAANTAVTHALVGSDPYEKLEQMKELKAVTVEDIPNYAEVYEYLVTNGVRVTVGGYNAIQNNADMFDAIFSLNPSNEPPESIFVDVAIDDPRYGAIEMLTANGILVGVGDGRFSPDTALTNGQLWTVLSRLVLGEPDPSDPWYASAHQAMASVGLVGPDADGAAPATRQEIADIIYTLAYLLGMDISAGSDIDVLAFADGAEIDAAYVPAVQWALATGILTEVDGAILPTGVVTRGDAALIVYQFLMMALA